MSVVEIHHADSRGNRHQSRASTLEKLVLVQFGVLIVFTSWAFGGQAPWARQVIAAWGALGVLLLIAATRLGSGPRDSPRPSAWRWLWPLLLYDAIVVAGCFNPSFKEAFVDRAPVLVLGDPKPWLPSSALPQLALRELWHFNVIVLSCFNLGFTLRSRRLVRVVLFILAVNAVVLAVFGTFQKLVHADGLWLGLVPSPNAKFFATFIYPNHWGAFTVLNISVCLGLLFHFIRRGYPRGLWHSPVSLGAVATLLLAAAIPLCGSRSCTVLAALLLGGAVIHLTTRTIRRRRERNESALLPAAGIVLAAVLALAAVGYLGRDVIAQRARFTSDQLARFSDDNTFTSRLTLYRDTWRMAAAKPWFGWGLRSYAHVFRIYNSQRTPETWWWIPFYAEAHSDWLQSLAEVGFVGTALLALLVLLPLRAVPWRSSESVLPRYLLAGDALILLYAWLEFPFVNPAVLITFGATFYCAIRYAELDLRSQREEAP